MVDWFGTIVSYIGPLFMWVAVILFLIAAFGVFIFLKKRSRFFIKLIEVIDEGDGRVNVLAKRGRKNLKAGWFARDRTFFGLIETGKDRELISNDGRVVQQGSSLDYQTYNDKKCLFVMRKPDDPSVLVPIKYFRLSDKSKQMLADIAPADYTDAAAKAFEETVSENKSKSMQILDKIVNITAIIVILLILILGARYVSQTNDSALKFTEENIDKCYTTAADACKQVCQAGLTNSANTLPPSNSAV